MNAIYLLIIILLIAVVAYLLLMRRPKDAFYVNYIRPVYNPGYGFRYFYGNNIDGKRRRDIRRIMRENRDPRGPNPNPSGNQSCQNMCMNRYLNCRSFGGKNCMKKKIDCRLDC